MPDGKRTQKMDAVTPWYWEKVDLFDEVDASARELFFRNATRKAVRKGQHVFRSDDDANQVFYLQNGLVRIYHRSPEGNATIFWFCAPGDLFGAGGITGSLTQSVNGEAVAPCVVHSVSRKSFEQMMRLNPNLAANVIRLMGARLRLACDSLVDLRTARSDQRIARALLRLAINCGERIDDGVRLNAPVTHQDIADMVGSCRQTVNEILHQFEKRGWVAFGGRRIVLCAPELLKAFADNPLSARASVASATLVNANALATSPT